MNRGRRFDEGGQRTQVEPAFDPGLQAPAPEIGATGPDQGLPPASRRKRGRLRIPLSSANRTESSLMAKPAASAPIGFEEQLPAPLKRVGDGAA